MSALLGCASSGEKSAKTSAAEAAPQKAVVVFNADSAFSYVKAQTDFGPRVPGTKASKQCAQWLMQKLEQFGAENVAAQEANIKAYNGDALSISNITAQWNPSQPERVLLLAHYDSRPWADQEEDAELRAQPIDGANDGASGVGVILEIVRNLQENNPKVGVDVLFVDAEDYGRKADEPWTEESDESWCLGTQYWLRQPTLDVAKIRYAVLLDMVGGKNARFPREMHSQILAKKINDKVYRAARMAGTSQNFPDELGGAIVDDHVYLLKAGIPAVDIIESANPETGSFPPTWHTHADNISNIDPATLKAVGTTVTQMIMNEK